MKTSVFLLSAVMTLFLTCGCSMHVIRGDGKLVTDNIRISDYSQIEVNGGNLEFTYQQTDSLPGLEITVDENIREMLEIKVADNKLIIRPIRRGMNLHPSTFIIKSNSRGLTRLDFAGSGKFEVSGPLKTTLLDLDIAGSGNINLPDTIRAEKVKLDLAGSGKFTSTYLESNEFNGDIAGSGAITLGGKVHSLFLDIAGSGDVSAFDCEIYDLTSSIAGSGKIDVTVINSIKSSVAGSGKIRYKGPVTQIESSNMGSGSVTKVD